jgi:hypothetical protein
MTHKSQDHAKEARFDDSGDDPGQTSSNSAGQSGDSQGLSRIAESAAESVEQLAEDDQPYEAETVQGLEDAGDHPEQPVRSHQDRRPSSEIPPYRDWE